MTERTSGHPIARRLYCAAAVAAVAGALAGCGSDGDPAAPGTPENPLVASSQESPVSGRTNEATTEKSHARAQAETAPKAPNYQQLLERQTSRPDERFTPCNLVTPARAQAILGAPIHPPVEAPQGPTCIYRARSGNALSTVAVQRLRFSVLARQLRTKRVEIPGARAYCAAAGSTVYVPLSGGRVLTVGGPCDVARQFASAALKRLAG